MVYVVSYRSDEDPEGHSYPDLALEVVLVCHSEPGMDDDVGAVAIWSLFDAARKHHDHTHLARSHPDLDRGLSLFFHVV